MMEGSRATGTRLAPSLYHSASMGNRMYSRRYKIYRYEPVDLCARRKQGRTGMYSIVFVENHVTLCVGAVLRVHLSITRTRGHRHSTHTFVNKYRYRYVPPVPPVLATKQRHADSYLHSSTMSTTRKNAHIAPLEDVESLIPILSVEYDNDCDDDDCEYGDGDCDAKTIKRSHSAEGGPRHHRRTSSVRSTSEAESSRIMLPDDNSDPRYYYQRQHSGGSESTSGGCDSVGALEQQQQQQQQHYPEAYQASSLSYQQQLWQYQQQVAAYYAQQGMPPPPNYDQQHYGQQQQTSPTNYLQQQQQQQQQTPATAIDYQQQQQLYAPPWPGGTGTVQKQQQQFTAMQHAAYQHQQQTAFAAATAVQSQHRSRDAATLPSSAVVIPKSNSFYPQQPQNQVPEVMMVPYKHDLDAGAAPDVYAALLQGTGQSYGTVKPAAAVPLRRPPPPFWSPQQDPVNNSSTSTTSNKRGLPPSRSSNISGTKYQQDAIPPPPLSSSKPTSPLHKAHRRASSDDARRMLQQQSRQQTKPTGHRTHSRHGSAGGRLLLPADPLRARKKVEGTNTTNTNSIIPNRQRAGSGSLLPMGSPNLVSGRPPASASSTGSCAGGGGGRPTHRRGSSLASTSGMSFMSEASMISIVSDIRKSVFFGGIHEKSGKVQLNYPFGNVHLLPIEREMDDLVNKGSKSLQLGRLYKVTIDDEEFEEYHRAAEDSSWLGDYEDDMSHGFCGGERRCRCDCPNCATCSHKAGGLLPPNFFCLTVEDDIYQRVLDEICASQQMPCGLFFCGHHEDVSRPSIVIALCFVLALFGAMGLVAFYF